MNVMGLPELEQLAARVRRSVQVKRPTPEDDLAAMAADPEIQQELRKIEEEFRGVEMDGLERSS